MAHRDKEWDAAEALSCELGHPFKDRHGVMQCMETRDLVGLALQSWCKKTGVTYR